jgi:acyl-CoA synthetase (AMP-forming)/AMP-acid ligase II
MNEQRNTVPWRSIPQMLAENCLVYGEQIALVDGDHSLTYADLLQATDRWVCILDTCKIGPGDRVCLWAQNSWEWVVCALAVWRMGAIVVPLSSRMKALDAHSVLAKSAASVLVSTADCGGVDLPALLAAEFGTGDGAAQPIAGLLTLSRILCLGDQPSSVPSELASALYQPDRVVAEPELSGAELAEILYTSGTTGEPKGVMLNHQQVLQAYWDWSDLGGLGAGDRFLVAPPFSHGFGINAGIVACVMRGMMHVVVGFFEPDQVLRQVEAYGVTVMSGTPALFDRLSAQSTADPSPLSSVRVVYVGAAHVSTELILDLQNSHNIERVINAYGLIEGCVVSMTREDDPVSAISKTVGRPMPGVEIAIVDETGQTMAPGSAGEIRVRGYGVMQGYLDAPELTASTCGDGWLRTGDAGLLDDDGYLHIVGRLKEMYITNGFNVYPAEIEDYLMQHPAVAVAAVVGVSEDKRGEAGVAFLVPVDQAGQDDDPLVWLRKKIASYKVPIAFEWLPALPLNDNGKVRKDVLTQQAESLFENNVNED